MKPLPFQPSKSIYIAGPMRGYKDLNFPAFDAAKTLLQQYFGEVISPADLSRQAGKISPNPDAAELREIALTDLTEIVSNANAIYMLRGWERSPGARAEYAVAEWLGLNIYFEKDQPQGAPERSILDEAKAITEGDRRRDYDKATPNHARIAGAWNWYLLSRKHPRGPLSALDVAHMMLLLKIARAVFTPTRDSYVDIAGYARCGAQISGFEHE